MPVVYRLVPSETVVGNVVWEQVEEPLAVEVVVVLDVVLLRRYHGQVFLLLTPDCIVIYIFMFSYTFNETRQQGGYDYNN